MKPNLSLLDVFCFLAFAFVIVTTFYINMFIEYGSKCEKWSMPHKRDLVTFEFIEDQNNIFDNRCNWDDFDPNTGSC